MAGWLELGQSNSASNASFSQNFGRRLLSPTAEIYKKSGSSQAGSSQGSNRSLRHLCWRVPQGPGSAGSRELPRAGNGQ